MRVKRERAVQLVRYFVSSEVFELQLKVDRRSMYLSTVGLVLNGLICRWQGKSYQKISYLVAISYRYLMFDKIS